MLNIYVLDDLSSFNYVKNIVIMFMRIDAWMKCVWIDLKGMNVCCGWDLSYANID
jgi:hypothetical protein